MRAPERLPVWLALSLLAVAGRSPAASSRTMVVHLPEAPIESMGQLADGVTQLASYLQTAVPEVTLDVKAFRKWEDASAFVTTGEESVAFVLCDPAFLLDLPASFVPRYRFVRGGAMARRRLVVVKSSSGLASLSALKGRALAVSISGGPGASRYLTQAIFGEEVEPAIWFSRIDRETDDFTSLAAVLYDRIDAALVAEDNPLVVNHLGKELTEVYATTPLSLAVIAIRRGVHAPHELAALDQALAALATAAATEPIRSVLKIDGIESVADPDRFYAELRGRAAPRRELEIALPPLPRLGTGDLAPLSPDAVPFAVGVELAEVPISRELVDSVLGGEGAGASKGGREP